MYQRILVCVDGSNTSNLALDEAIKLATEQSSKVRIVHVVDAASVYAGDFAFVDISELQKALTEAGRQILQQAMAVTTKASIQAETRLLETGQFNERVADVVAGEAAAWPADLIVIGTHGRRGLSHLLLGSVAEGIMRVAPAPVLLIRGK